ncbi:uncharacterized protein DEA37_0001012 [Paragonimus westermani]|uniref:Doublecortin domain-containing protein n=1 Tax=Paragonimus westermani TaxID=34504 RepID=A0A5J4NUQ2_9TREM|nr:uncharacterized protein DEA37_0001012 [Paragonimus westermani]
MVAAQTDVDGDLDSRGIRMAIHPNRYRSLEALLSDLTEKMPKLSCGARAVYTPRGRLQHGKQCTVWRMTSWHLSYITQQLKSEKT